MEATERNDQPPLPRRRAPGGAVFYCAFAALLIFHCAVNIWWLRADNHPLYNDDSMHMEAARNYYALLAVEANDSLADRWLNVFRAQNYQPPLLHIAAALVLTVTGYGPDIIAGTVTVYFLLIIMGAYAIGRTFLGRWEALFAATLVSLTPIVYGASRTFMTDYLSAACVVWAMYCLIRSDGFRNTGWVFCFALLNGAGIMTKQTTFVFYFFPCVFLVLWGFLEAFCATHPPRRFRFDLQQFKTMVLNSTMTLVVTLGIILPWHLYHYDFLTTFYTTHFYGGEGFLARRFKNLDLQVMFGKAGLVLLLAGAGWYFFSGARKRLLAQGSWTNPWLWSAVGAGALTAALFLTRLGAEYAVFLLSEGAFLPLCALGAIGFFLAFSAERRSMPLFLILLWLVTSYLVLSFVFTSRVPRYILPAAPGFVLLAAMACCAIRPILLRGFVMIALLGLLSVQFFHLTVGAFQPQSEGNSIAFKNIVLPPLSTSETAPPMARTSWPILKDHIIAGNYAFRPVQRAYGFDNRIFQTMAEDMRTRRPIYEDWANYQKLTNFHNFEGFWFNELHYRPEPNPFSLPEIEPAPRPFRAIGTRWQRAPEDLLNRLGDTDFVLIWSTYPPDDGEAGVQQARAREQRWQAFFAQRGFTVLDHFEQAAYNDAHDGFYTVMGRVEAEREPLRSWDFTKLPREEWTWRFDPGAEATPDGAVRSAPWMGPILWLDEPGMDASAFNTVRLHLEAFKRRAAGEAPVFPEMLHFYWAREGDIEPGAWPFVNERGVRFRRVGEHIYEASLARHQLWNAALGRLMIDIKFPTPPVAPADATLRWDFTRLPKQAWEWRFDKGADRTPTVDGALRMTRASGPHAYLERPFAAGEYASLLVRMDGLLSTRLGDNPVPISGMKAYWATPKAALEEAWPYTEENSLAFEPLGAEHPGFWVAPLSTHAGWRGAIQRIMLRVDVPEEKLTDSLDHFSLHTKEIALVGSGGNNPEEMIHIRVKQLELLR